MIRFNSDYTEGAHPLILEKLIETNMEQTGGYGCDPHCARAADLIRRACEAPDAAVHFLVGGTQTNVTVIDSILKPYQGVLAAETAHIQVHETGAVEATGHKVLVLPSANGKITGTQVAEAVKNHYEDDSFEHMVQPGMVYISNPTETGTIYKKAELEELSRVCKELGLPLFLDGARLGYGLMCQENDLTLADIAELTDVFYIGGTKVGALFGEAVVITKEEIKKDFRYQIKRHGGMLAKGRLLGIQFETLFDPELAKGCLYFQISAHAARLAEKLRAAWKTLGYDVLIDSPTNQQFPILPDELIQKLKETYAFEYMKRIDEMHSAVRFCTCWATRESAVDALISDLK